MCSSSQPHRYTWLGRLSVRLPRRQKVLYLSPLGPNRIIFEKGSILVELATIGRHGLSALLLELRPSPVDNGVVQPKDRLVEGVLDSFHVPVDVGAEPTNALMDFSVAGLEPPAKVVEIGAELGDFPGYFVLVGYRGRLARPSGHADTASPDPAQEVLLVDDRVRQVAPELQGPICVASRLYEMFIVDDAVSTKVLVASDGRFVEVGVVRGPIPVR